MPTSKSGELGFVRSTEPRMIGKLRSRNDLNAMSRRSTSDLVSLSSFLRPVRPLGWRGSGLALSSSLGRARLSPAVDRIY